MKYTLKLMMEGDFPGSPDVESCEITELEYEILADVWIRGGREVEDEIRAQKEVNKWKK